MNSSQHNSGGSAADTFFDALVTSLVGWVWRLIGFTARWVWRLPVLTFPTIGIGVLGWFYGGGTMVAATGAYAALMCGWSVADRASLARHTVGIMRGRWVVWRRYRSWAAICIDCRLSRTRGDRVIVPTLRSVELGADADVLTVIPARGQPVSDFHSELDALADAFEALSVTATRTSPGQIELTVHRHQPLTQPLTPHANNSSTTSDLSAGLAVGACADGRPWLLHILGAHILIGGVTGAGKGSVLWSIIGALAPSVATGHTALWVADPKGGMELSAGADLYARFAYTAETIATMLTDAADIMADRAQRLRGTTRQHTPTPDEPLIVVIVDELAALTVFADRKLKTEIDRHLGLLLTQGRAVGVSVVAAVQDPSKDVVPLRQLFPTRIALRMAESTQTTMILGPGATDRGALAHHLPEHLPGLGYILLDGTAAPTLVRAFHYTDTHINTLNRTYGTREYPNP
ncbi:FtsK/SpoIIIE domain-containing protein [Gordonia sp. CPCC 205333]|uniref:FtsK/SpoIIIE domain-containing protein n=1 Tax=Gordonia sp. CPCC 205333 TaxID=3140790 RepID=UPI003AF36D43